MYNLRFLLQCCKTSIFNRRYVQKIENIEDVKYIMQLLYIEAFWSNKCIRNLMLNLRKCGYINFDALQDIVWNTFEIRDYAINKNFKATMFMDYSHSPIFDIKSERLHFIHHLYDNPNVIIDILNYDRFNRKLK
jgi:hypothetical protein